MRRTPPIVPPDIADVLDGLERELHDRHYSPKTIRAYAGWIRRISAFHARHPRDLGPTDIFTFLDQLVRHQRVSAATHQQALCAIVFLYRRVLRVEPPWLEDLVRPARPPRLPLVLSRDEVRRVLEHMQGVPRLMAALLYGSGLRVIDAADCA